MSDKIIEGRSESERRQHQRRREDQFGSIEQSADEDAVVAELDRLSSELSIAKHEHLQRERRYHLLHAAAWLHESPSLDDMEDMSATQRRTAHGNAIWAAVETAEDLLAEIERREGHDREGKDEPK